MGGERILGIVQRLVVVAAIACALRADAEPAETVDLEFVGAPLVELLPILAEVGGVNIVLLGDSPRVDVRYKRVPWDRALDDLVARAKLAKLRDRGVILVADPATIAARRKAPRRAYTRAPIDVDFADADATAAARLVATATGLAYELAGAARGATLRMRGAPSDQVIDVLSWQTGASIVDKPHPPPAAPSGCVATGGSFHDVRMVGAARRKDREWALLVDARGAPYVVEKGACVGSESARIDDVSLAYVRLVDGTAEHMIQLHPTHLPP
jgi:hypothetical protein